MPPTTIEYSVVLPVYNEVECIAEVITELRDVLASSYPGRYEIVAVDDGSTDATHETLSGLIKEIPQLRLLRMAPNAGQSTALVCGMRRARGHVLITMDADGQQDPTDIPGLVERLKDADCCCGWRRERQDARSKRIASKVANAVRNAVLGEDIIDSGCSLKAFSSRFVTDLPLWHGVHRFLPTFFAMQGARIVQAPVHHRPRKGGASKYTNLGRLRITLRDLFGVRWIKSRFRSYSVKEAHEHL